MTDDILHRYPDVAGQPLRMALLCAPLLSLRRDEDAYAIGRAALAAAPGDAAVRDLVRRALSSRVAPFHGGMLRDAPRNACYAAAIERLVTPGMRVLEIGTGAGLLALLAARAGAQVVTCESNPLIAAAAREIVARNGLADRIRVVAKRSTALEVGEDLDAPCDALISEVFGRDLFDEGVVASVNDARARLLAPGAAIVPPRAELRCALVRDGRPDDIGLDDVLGFDLSPFASLTERRRSLPPLAGERVGLRSAPVSALRADFTRAVSGSMHDRIVLTSEGGRIDGVVHWLHLDFGAGTTYENAPFASPLAHWATPVHLFATPIDTVPGQAVAVDVRLFGTRLTVGAAEGDALPSAAAGPRTAE